MRGKVDHRSPLAENLRNARPFLIGCFAIVVLTMLRLTLRYRRVGSVEGTFDRPGVVCFWHGHLLMSAFLWRELRVGAGRCPGYQLSSAHHDGRIIATAIRFVGIRSVLGSSSRGGVRALHALIRFGRQGNWIGFTPDGPRGPRHEVKGGVIKVAQKSGLPIVPIANGAERCWRLRSWDGMFVPKPFSRTVVVIGSPISVPSDCSEEDLTRYGELLEGELNRISAEAENFTYSKSNQEGV
jgi:lysophospholipid acyltransferase (LPLAT)-like uncharacterized protein